MAALELAAAALLAAAVIAAPAAPAAAAHRGGDGSSSRSASRSTGSGRHGSSSSSGSSSKLTAMLWEQFEQSGILQQLPTILTRQALDIQSPQGQPVRQQTRLQSQAGFGLELFTRSEYTVSLFELLHNLNKLQPSFLTAHPAGQQCLVPALHLALSSVQSISTAVKQAGPQECLENWLQYSWNATRITIFPAAKQLLDSIVERPVGAGTSSSTSSSGGTPSHPVSHDTDGSSGGTDDSSGQVDAALALLQTEQTVQWVCVDTLVAMLAQFLIQAPAIDAATRSSSSSSSALNSGRARGSPATTSSSSSSSSRRQPVTGSVSRKQW